MSRKTARVSPISSVRYPASESAVVTVARKLFKRPQKTLNKRTVRLDQLPELTDAWFAEVIQQIDEATARLQK